MLFSLPQQLVIGNIDSILIRSFSGTDKHVYLFLLTMQNYFRYRGLMPVLKRVYDSFGDKMNYDFFYVMVLLVSEQPWSKIFNVDSSFSKGKPIPTSVSIRKLLSMSSYALGSYHTDKQSLAHFLSLPEKDILFFNSVASLGKPACFLALNHHSKEYGYIYSIMARIVTSIRGTQSELDVLRDLIIQPSRLEGGLVHSGMRDEANDVITTLKPLIDKQLIHYPDYRVVFTGHSLGAGAAAIATLVLQSVYSNVFAYCFACPSCVSLNLLPRLQNCVITVNNMHDFVPRMNSLAMHQVRDVFASMSQNQLMIVVDSPYLFSRT